MRGRQPGKEAAVAPTPSSPWKLEAGLLRGQEGAGGEGGRGRALRVQCLEGRGRALEGKALLCPDTDPHPQPRPHPSSPSELEI